MKIPILQKSASGFPLVIVLGAGGIWYFFLKDRNKKV